MKAVLVAILLGRVVAASADLPSGCWQCSVRSMADIKSALKNIPDKQPKEERASDQQLAYLRSFGYFSEKLIKGLGAGQASYLIDQALLIKEDGSARIDASNHKTRKKGGCGILVFLLVVGILVIVMVKKWSGSGNDNPGREFEPQREEISREIPKEAGTPKASERIEPVESVAQTEKLPSESEATPLKLAEIQYPVTVQTTKLFSLFNKEGKETPIAPGTTIEIIERSDLGTLKMEIDGELFVGNESRIAGSIELK